MTYRWLVVALTLLMQAASYGILVYSFALFVIPWLTAFETNRADIMLSVFVLQIAMGVISPLVGRMLDRYSPGWMVPLGGLMIAVGLGLASLATSFWQITLIYATVLPIAITLTGPMAAQTIITKWFSNKRGLAIGISAVGTSIGGFLVPLLSSALLSQFGWRTALQFLALVAVVAISPIAFLVLRRRPPDQHSISSGIRHAVPPPDQQVWSTGEILSTRNFWLPVLALLPLAMAFGGVQFNLAAYAQDLGNSLPQSAWLISLLSISMIIGKLFFGFMSDRIDHRKLYWIAALFMIMTLTFLQGRPSYVLLCTCSVLMGLSVGGLLPLLGAIYSQRFGARSFGRVIGLVTMVITLGGFGPLIAGEVFDKTGSYDAAFQFFLWVLIPAALGMIWLKKHQ